LRDSQGSKDALNLQYGAYPPEPVETFSASSRFAHAARSVGRLQLEILPKGRAEAVLIACSSVLIATDLVMTAAHCLRAKQDDTGIRLTADPLKAGVRFGLYDDNNAQSELVGQLFDLEPKPAEIDPKLDFAIFRLTPDAAARVASAGFFPAKFSGDQIVSGMDAFVIGHPLAWPLRISRANCRILSVPAGGASSTRVKHSCGTAPGVSGAPVFDDVTCAVVALHVEAPDRTLNDGLSVGFAVPVLEIAARSGLMRRALNSPGAMLATCGNLRSDKSLSVRMQAK
jgi:hypothetical protein